MSVTRVLDDEIDISRGDTITGTDTQAGRGVNHFDPHVGRRFEADVVWMDERPLDPARLYMLKHTTRTVTVEANRPLALNQIETVTLATSRPLVFDRYRDIRATGSFILIDPSTNFTAGAGMIIDAIRDDHAAQYRPNAAERLVKIARSAPSHEAAVAAMQRAIEELLK
jgi:sulfate adenylyltransferase subunit 1 (EFTu-like GTPase family)